MVTQLAFFEPGADDPLRFSTAVAVGSVEIVDPCIDRTVHQRKGGRAILTLAEQLGRRADTPEAAAAEAEDGYAHAGSPEISVLHPSPW